MLKELKELLEKSGLEDHRVLKVHKVLEEELVMSVPEDLRVLKEVKEE